MVAGLPVAEAAFRFLDPAVRVTCLVADGDRVLPGNELAEVEGPARSVLTGERTALNLLGRLVGHRHATRHRWSTRWRARAPRSCAPARRRPGLRALEKYAVRVGGGSNHRFGLDDAVLIKDNHIAIAGGVAEAVARVGRRVGHLVKVEVEVDTLDQLDEVLGLAGGRRAARQLSCTDLRAAVTRVEGRLVTEASGGITAERCGPWPRAGSTCCRSAG